MEHKDTGQLRGVRVLVVDDSELMVLLVEKKLAKWGVELTVARDGLEGVHRVVGGRFDLVLMDLNLPGMDGMTAALEIEKFRPGLPIIAMTGNEDAPPEPFFEYVRKPINDGDLYKKMVRALRR